MANLESVAEVQIDPEGTFKYILIRVSAGAGQSEPHRDVVRGTKSAEYHSEWKGGERSVPGGPIHARGAPGIMNPSWKVI